MVTMLNEIRLEVIHEPGDSLERTASSPHPSPPEEERGLFSVGIHGLDVQQRALAAPREPRCAAQTALNTKSAMKSLQIKAIP
jgi:hypothetical protein